MELNELLAEALDAVNEAKLPDDLPAIPFEKAVDILSGRHDRGHVAPTD